MNQIQIWQNRRIVDTIQQLEGAMKVGENVQILLNVIGDCKNQITRVERPETEALQRCGDFANENDR